VVSTFLCPVWPWCVQSMMSVKGSVLKILTGQYINMSSLTPWPLTSKSIGVIYFSQCTSLQSLKSVKQRVLKISRNYCTHMSSSTSWPLNLKICSGHLLSMMYKSTNFEVCQANGFQDIE
jgi:hypothetical protein